MKEIKICKEHQDYKTPLIWTFAFIGAEYWCAYCGFTGGMLGSGIMIKETPILLKRKKSYEKSTGEYLHANGITYCSKTKWKGELINPEELPQEEKDRLKKIREEFLYKVEVENHKTFMKG